MHCLSSLYWVTTPVHVSGPFIAHHQEIDCIDVVNNTCLLQSRLSEGLGSLTGDLVLKQVQFATSVRRADNFATFMCRLS
jgi:hypothetical protein